MIRPLLAAAALLCTLSTGVAAVEPLTPYTLSGAGLLALCQSAPDCRWQYIFGVIETFLAEPQQRQKSTTCAEIEPPCPDMIVGWEDAELTIQQWPKRSFKLCVPSAVHNPILAADEVRVVMQYIKSHPVSLNASASSVIFNAIQWGFECKSSSSPSSPHVIRPHELES
jgi:hypothetical protein